MGALPMVEDAKRILGIKVKLVPSVGNSDVKYFFCLGDQISDWIADSMVAVAGKVTCRCPARKAVGLDSEGE